ncbi:hypothetical protein VTK73DRAFT_723 [Phialemonium thermophilum]|uniref:Uncharacterized protein n=1 Tax=Phialemonium thermophilum TaxID=223376 RepID=A0ABR3VUH9_9PEZI
MGGFRDLGSSTARSVERPTKLMLAKISDHPCAVGACLLTRKVGAPFLFSFLPLDGGTVLPPKPTATRMKPTETTPFPIQIPPRVDSLPPFASTGLPQRRLRGYLYTVSYPLSFFSTSACSHWFWMFSSSLDVRMLWTDRRRPI